MSEHRDRQLEEYLAGNSCVSRAYEALGDDSPPPDLDQAVLQAARCELEADQRARWLRWSRWAVPASLAAVFVLCLAVVLQLTVTPWFSTTEAPTAATPGEISPARTVDPAPQYREGIAAGRSRQTRGQVPGPDAAGTAGPQPEAEPVAGVASSVAATPPPPQAPAAELSMSFSQHGALADSPPPHVGGAGRSALQPPPDRPTTSLEQLLAQVREEEARLATQFLAAPAGTTERVDAVMEPATPAAAAGERPAGETEPTSPEAWLDSIEQLLVQGRVTEAYGQMRRFNRAYPNYEVAARSK